MEGEELCDARKKLYLALKFHRRRKYIDALRYAEDSVRIYKKEITKHFLEDTILIDPEVEDDGSRM